VTSIHAPEYPILNAVLNMLLKKQATTGNSMSFGLSQAQDALDYLAGHSLKEAITDTVLPSYLLHEILKLKSADIANLFTARDILQETLLSFIVDYTTAHPFREIEFEQFNRAFMERHGADWREVLPRWYTIDQLPIFLVKDFRIDPVKTGDDESMSFGDSPSRASWSIFNDSDVDGCVTLSITSIESGGRGIRGGSSIMMVVGTSGPMSVMGYSSKTKTYNYQIPARTGKRVAVMVERSSMPGTLNMNLSRNLPAVLMISLARPTPDTSQYELPVGRDYFLPDTGEIIVDNEDPGFTMIHPATRFTLQEWFQKTPPRKYSTDISHADVTSGERRWTPFINAETHGLAIRSAVKKAAGKGDARLEWKATVTRPGTYEVYVTIPWNFAPFTLKSTYANGTTTFNYAGSDKQEVLQHYTLTTAGGTEEASIDLTTGRGWRSLGRFRFTPGDYTVTLSDRGVTDQIIIGDAVKWVHVGEE
jgi:hypothetical protein